MLLTVWYAANQICSKRLVPFIPELVASLEKFGHLSLTVSMRQQLLSISSASVDRLLKVERQQTKKGLSTTKPGSLLKKQIQVHTFMDWDEVIPGFCEADLVAHCGDRVNGTFLNTLVLTDITSGWTEFLALLKRSEADVIAALKIAQKLLPFPLLGLDTDNGSEFINYELLKFCKSQQITFTRSRAYRKNDQAHVEEKNGSIVRRLNVSQDRLTSVAHSVNGTIPHSVDAEDISTLDSDPCSGCAGAPGDTSRKRLQDVCNWELTVSCARDAGICLGCIPTVVGSAATVVLCIGVQCGWAALDSCCSSMDLPQEVFHPPDKSLSSDVMSRAC